MRRILDAFAGRPHIFNLGHGILQDTPIAHVEELMTLIKISTQLTPTLRRSSKARQQQPTPISTSSTVSNHQPLLHNARVAPDRPHFKAAMTASSSSSTRQSVLPTGHRRDTYKAGVLGEPGLAAPRSPPPRQQLRSRATLLPANTTSASPPANRGELGMAAPVIIPGPSLTAPADVHTPSSQYPSRQGHPHLTQQ